MRRDQAETLRVAGREGRTRLGRPAKRRQGLRLAIVSGKGGVGKSTLAVNVATACAGMGASTLLVDGDAGLANADLLMGLVPERSLSQWCAGEASLPEVVTRGPNGLDLLVSGVGAEAARCVAQSVLGGMEDDLGRMAAAHRITIVDLGAGIGAGVLDLAVECDLVWLVATTEPTSLADAYTMSRRLWERNRTLRLELIVNRTPDQEAGRKTHASLARLTQRFLGQGLSLRAVLPEDPCMGMAVARQEPVVSSHPRSKVARRLAMLAEALLEEAPGPELDHPRRTKAEEHFLPA